MTEQRQKLLDKFDKWLDSKPRKQIISAQCANIAEDYAKEQLILSGVSNRRELLIAYELRHIEHPNIVDKEVAKQQVQAYLSNLLLPTPVYKTF